MTIDFEREKRVYDSVLDAAAGVNLQTTDSDKTTQLSDLQLQAFQLATAGEIDSEEVVHELKKIRERILLLDGSVES